MMMLSLLALPVLILSVVLSLSSLPAVARDLSQVIASGARRSRSERHLTQCSAFLALWVVIFVLCFV